MKTQKFHFFYFIIIGILFIYNLYITDKIITLKKYSYSNNLPVFSINKTENIKNEKVALKIKFFVDNFKLKKYSGTKFKITSEGKKIINNIRILHKSASLIGKSNAHKELCAGYIWLLSEKIWGDETPYHIGMMNSVTRSPAKAWELPTFYSGIGGNVLIDLGEKFSVNKKDFWEKITKGDIKMFFKTAFLEESLLGDIGFLYKDTKYTSFLNGWSSNSHITKNIGISKFEFIVGKDYKNQSNLSIISDSIGCSKNINSDIFSILENYNIKINGTKVYFKAEEFYYLNKDNTLGEKINLKYLDKISYDDITLTHYLHGRSNVNGLFDMTCSGKFFPINIISINSRLIEKI